MMVESPRPIAWPGVIQKKLAAIRELARTFGVERLEVFGSVMTDRYSPFSSDIAFLVTYPSDYDFGPFLGRYQELQSELGYEMSTRVDLVISNVTRRDRFWNKVNKTRQVIYDAAENP